MSESRRPRLLLAMLGIVCTTSFVVVSLYRLGLPLTLYTWVVVTLCAAAGATLAINGKRRLLIFPTALVVCVYLAIPDPFQVIPFVEKWSLFDDVGGRSGWAITPGLKFGKDGPNTAILESYVGSLEPNWWYQAPHSPYIRDGNERVQSRNVIRYEYFPHILEMLPDDDARRTVIKALTDTENRLRVHQGLLLACLRDLKYPAGTERNSWWLHHREFFKSEHDPIVAASLVQGWLENIDRIYSDGDVPFTIMSQCRAVGYQQRGSWGGHYDFGEAFMEIEFGERKLDARSRELAGSVVWWPERQTQIPQNKSVNRSGESGGI
ncbi:hypothetical protein [Lignipirellula cremea]|uniref:Uncharacterized protein n=1 Tax=Lignipirellula cremea TaxID=2528010 RepID=A0A518DRB6_9BACT|nr:hypothetical protein [Lignipirellula cremea]QDU94381.1 hypothetical protein Pla8534_21700 [Lignipirellula cremea]